MHLTQIWRALSLCAVLLVSKAFAQDAAGAQARSDMLFHQGMQQLYAGDFAAACDNLDASYKLVPRTGTLLNLGVCHSQQGQILQARGELSEARRLAERDGQADRVLAADDYLQQLDAKLSFLDITALATQDAASVPRLLIDGNETTFVAEQPLAVLPGKHTLRAEAVGYEAREQIVDAEAGRHVRVELAALPRQHVVEAAPPPPAAAPEALRADVPLQHPHPSDALRTAALVVGIVGVATSLGFGAWALERKLTLQETCKNRECTNERELSIARTGKTVATISTVAFSVGAVGFAAWVLLPGGPVIERANDTRAGLTVHAVF